MTQTSAETLWLNPINLGGLHLNNRLVMAPLTRMRANEHDIPTPLAAEYYAQRSCAGLIITEATQISRLGKGYPGTPGIYTKEQGEEWKKIVEAVHKAGSKIVLQLWHVGRISHSSFHPQEGLPWAPSAIAPTQGQTLTSTWSLAPYETPHEMTIDNIKTLLSEYKRASELSYQAGFDGVEVHAANGYLLNEFLEDRSNKRTDQYGGTIDNRMRIIREVLEVVCSVFPSNRVGIRLSPYGTFNDMGDSDPLALYNYVIDKLNNYDLAYLHLIEPRSSGAGGGDSIVSDVPLSAPLFRERFKGKVISAGGYTKETAEQALISGHADAIAFGRYFISNPDLLKRLVHNYPLNPYQRATFYGGGAQGYTDYSYYHP